MNKVICCPTSLLPDVVDPEINYFVLYSYAPFGREGIGYIAPTLLTDIRRDGLAPSVKAWDFASIAFAVAAADKAILRKHSSDGWTRMIELSVCLKEPGIWNNQRNELEVILRNLTGDFWKLNFLVERSISNST
jgi:hypothetical protein